MRCYTAQRWLINLSNMKHLVFGTGLIGGFIAGGLLRAECDTTLLGRDKHREAMSKGLTLSDLDGNFESLSRPDFFVPDSQASTEPHYDVVWLTVKATAVEGCVAQLREIINPSSIVICCQNGFGTDTYVKQQLPENTVLTAIVGFNVAEQKEAHLHRSTDGALVVESHPALAETITRLNSDILPTHTSDDIEAQRWAKLQLNLANPVNALADVPTKTMVEDADFRKVIVVLMRELLSVVEAKGLSLPKLTALPAHLLPKVMSLPNWIYLILAQKTLAIDPTARVSMWWDLSQGKPSEIMYLNQAVVEHGKEHAIACPYNERIVQLIHKVEQGKLNIGMSAKELQRRLGIT